MLTKEDVPFNSVYLLTFIDDGPLEINSHLQLLESGDLLISDVRETDAGKYKCVRANEAGTVSGEAYLTVMGT